MRQAGEPTVEEILDSIKKVIARDNRGTVADERRPLAGAEIEADEDDDDLDTTGVGDADDILDLSDGEMIADDGAFADELDDDVADSLAGPLTGEDARASMRDSLAMLAMMAEPGAQPQIVRSGETSLEGLVREMLRPMLAEWLDTNLPPMVERLVATEIARIVRKQG